MLQPTPIRLKKNNPEIIDHYFYHGEPYFTFNQSSSNKAEQLEYTETKIIQLNEHQKSDLKYCGCKKTPRKLSTVTQQSIRFSESPTPIPKYEEVLETEIYFRDVYRLSYNFH
ncbi:hypothetical protein NAL32_05615 [Chryseobacterium sp. Ch-15]|uniref:Uncharacterized protein n=1 Tax=Chryseobacterium muglaense TaxID=2893752 RepID=A0A9Q3UTD9_9FLAO|nr:hypothetical protein [Chryseobacterium muglaense]MBD3904052.1 hypothetical protein [Chryseobacterium muglaense]MCC9033375.1 hypothetical protein [Chryseobacterium muglaense]MCM2553870.1 hypothetical protein [Chryseobacterium muglaense]